MTDVVPFPSTHNGGPALDEVKAASGWIKIYRDIRRHHIVGFGQPVKPANPKRGSYSRAEAFQDLLMEAQYKPGRTNIHGSTVTLNVGQLVGARSFLADRWNWSERSVRTFLAHLVTDGIVKIDQLSGQENAPTRKMAPSIITLCNYTKYQVLETEISKFVKRVRRPANRPASDQQATSSRPASDQNLRRKEGEEGKNTSTPYGVEVVSPASQIENSRPPNGGAEMEGEELAQEVVDAAWKLTDELARKVKGGITGPPPRSARPKGELNGLYGITLTNGKLTVVNGVLASLQQEFPGVDFTAVCNKAAPSLSKIKFPTVDNALAALRQYAQYERDRQASNQAKPKRALDSYVASLSPERRQEFFAKLNEGGENA